jgi:RNA recognition motif-containing protein
MNIFVGNLSSAVTADDLRRVFSGYGTIVNAIVMRDTTSGRPLGYAHVYVEPARAGKDAIVEMDAAPLKGKPIVARECVQRGRRDRRSQGMPWQGAERRRGERRNGNS